MCTRGGFFRAMLVGCLLAWGAEAQAAGPKIYIVTDLEGASGVYSWAQARDNKSKETPLGQKAMEYFMGDLTAVVRGLHDAGAGEILVLDGHGAQAIVPHLMPPGAKYITGLPRPNPIEGLDGSFAGVVQLAAHSMMGTRDGVLNHTQDSVRENRYWYNGVESGELAQVAIYAGHFGVPTIMVSGDEATCRESRKFFGESCVTVAVKRWIAREAAVLYPFAETREALYEGAKRAVAAIPRCKPYKPSLPIQAKKQHLVFEGPEKEPRVVTKEVTIRDALHIYSF
ncbi:MAG: M55 family metallopeptidase [Planctomycetaceae bacterium]|nr:M55 family metallopeptidase [Planctomycetaceae bacterium]